MIFIKKLLTLFALVFLYSSSRSGNFWSYLSRLKLFFLLLCINFPLFPCWSKFISCSLCFNCFNIIHPHFHSNYCFLFVLRLQRVSSLRMWEFSIPTCSPFFHLSIELSRAWFFFPQPWIWLSKVCIIVLSFKSMAGYSLQYLRFFVTFKAWRPLPLHSFYWYLSNEESQERLWYLYPKLCPFEIRCLTTLYISRDWILVVNI